MAAELSSKFIVTKFEVSALIRLILLFQNSISSVAFPGKVIDVAGGATDNHAEIIIYDHKDDGSENQQFFLTHPNNA
ncbi:unnamed protein product [Aspergillus oryzae]|nr:unnamed protein product [Aspergillus oryzae]